MMTASVFLSIQVDHGAADAPGRRQHRARKRPRKVVRYKQKQFALQYDISPQPAPGKPPATAQAARLCRSLGRRPRQPARHATADHRRDVHGAGRPAPGFGVGACTGTARPNRFFPLGAVERPIFLTLASSTELAFLLTPDITPFRPLHPLAPRAAGKAWRLALAPLALCLARAAPAQTAIETATETATEASATTPPRLQEVRISADTDNGMGFAPDQAQTAGKAPMGRLETPQSVSVVTREQMESRQITNLQQALQTVAGVSPVNFGRRGFDDIHIRGFRSTESVLVDGLVQNTGMWAKLQPYGYERFEVLKGAASGLYCQVQPGGIINAVRKRLGPQAISEVGVVLGS